MRYGLKIRLIGINQSIAFLLGLLSTNNIVYLFVVGNTPIMLIEVFAVLFVLGYLLVSPNVVISKIAFFTKDLLCLFFFIILSIIPVMLYNSDGLHQWLAGLIALLLDVCVILLVLVLKGHIKYIINGIYVGLILNFLFVLYAYFMFKSGTPFTLKTYFPAWKSVAVQYSNVYISNGLFREPGHLMRYIAIISLVVWQKLDEKKGTTKLWLGIMLLVIAAFSRSSSVFLLMIGIVMYTLSILKRAKKITITHFLIIILIIIVAFLGLIITGTLLDSLWSSLADIFTDKGNSTRLKGMEYALEVIKKNPIMGCGWNLYAKTLSKLGYYGSVTGHGYISGAYSGALTLIAEIGFAGTFYLFFLLDKSIKLFSRPYSKYDVAIGTSLFIYLLEFCMTDFSLDGSVAVLIGLVLIEWSNYKSMNHIKNTIMHFNKTDTEV